jgi:sodium transport system permease protein
MTTPESRRRTDHWSLRRQARLTLKEFRETLRDRRTIVTLVLMPLLVYPLLSLSFQRLLISGVTGTAQDSTTLVLFESDEDGNLFRTMMRLNLLQRGEPDTMALPFDLDLRVTDDIEQSIQHGQASLGVRLRERPGEARGVEFELVHFDDPAGRRVATEIETRLRAANEALLGAQLQQLGGVPDVYSVRHVPLAGKAPTTPLATLVPLILILMTITGAVYPAIDLTAGERERGTLETLAASPVSPLAILIAKYLAVVCVAMMTATVNLLAMTVTIYFSGLGPLLFGDAGVSPAAMLQVFALLLLFALFFSALLLGVTSFARSFKEAQAYLIPLMLVAIAPGLLSMTPGIVLSGSLAVVPLVNIVLVARDIFQGVAEPGIVVIAVLTTLFYAVAAIAVAARVFAGDALLYGSHRSWSDLWRPSESWSPVPAASTALFCTALLFPLQFLAGGVVAQFVDAAMSTRLVASAGATIALFALLPLIALRLGHTRAATALRVSPPRAWTWLAVPLLGVSLWPLALELYRLGSYLGLAALTEAHLAHAEQLVREFQQLPGWLLVLTIGVAPGVCEELFFRGFLFSALRQKLSSAGTLVVTSVLFGLFHLVTPSMLATERLIPTTFLGLVLGWVCLRSGSVLPGMLVHSVHNSLLVLFSQRIGAVGWEGLTRESAQFSFLWLGVATAGVLSGLLCVELGRGFLRSAVPFGEATDAGLVRDLR